MHTYKFLITNQLLKENWQVVNQYQDRGGIATQYRLQVKKKISHRIDIPTSMIRWFNTYNRRFMELLSRFFSHPPHLEDALTLIWTNDPDWLRRKDARLWMMQASLDEVETFWEEFISIMRRKRLVSHNA